MSSKQNRKNKPPKWAPIKRAGEIVGYIEVFWGGASVGYVTIPGASRYQEAK
jgi:hypothetical protein